MCIPHGAVSSKDNGYVEKKEHKHITRVSQDEFEKGDPNFVDERKIVQEEEKKLSCFESMMEKLSS